MAMDEDQSPKVLRLLQGQKSRKEDRADRMLAALIILSQGGGRIVAAVLKVAVYLLAAIGVVSLIGR